MRKILFTLLLAVQPLAAALAEEEVTPEDDTIAIAEAYLAAYSTFDMSKVEPFLAEDAVFYDPTSTNQNADGGPFRFEGKAAVLKGLGDYAAQYDDFAANYRVARRYESAGMVVFIATLDWSLVGKDGETLSGSAPIVTAVGVRDGKVISHTDFYDYEGNAVEFSEQKP